MSRILSCFLAIAVTAPLAASEVPSFRNEVMAVFSRAGCNQGACHGNLNGKGGFKLSLRGEDPAFDRLALSRNAFGRRTAPHDPDQSLLLQKASGAVPHEGGPRFGRESIEYRLVRDWIKAGLPEDAPITPRLVELRATPGRIICVEPIDRFQIFVQARFSDGSVRDVSNLAVFETTSVGVAAVGRDGEVRNSQPGELVVVVRYLDKQAPVQVAFIPKRERFVWKEAPLHGPIDELLFESMRELRLTPSELCSDSVFLRRVYLDALGILPSVDEVREFLRDHHPDKRERLIDGLLGRPEFADYWAQKWADLLRNEEKMLDRKGVRVFHQWLRDCIALDKPLNQFAREVVAARGSTYANPPANFYRALREPYARAEAVAQVFLGARIQCAKCHNHPFDIWTQDDYHDFAAFFNTIDYRIIANDRRDKLDGHEFSGEQVVLSTRQDALKHPRTGAVLMPRFLGSKETIPAATDRLELLADWIADPSNPYFARAQVNRIWYHLMGRGLVEPIDDFRDTNPPVNQALLNYLTAQWRQSGFRLRPIVREIMVSRTYQLSSADGLTNRDDEIHCSKARVEPLEAEQLLDAVCRVLDTNVKFNGYPAGLRAGQIAALESGRRGVIRNDMGEKFLKVFGKPERLLTCECERSDDTGVMQSFQLLTGELLHELLREPHNRIGKLLARRASDDEILETFYLGALNRYPTEQEKQKLAPFLSGAKEKREAIEDLVWGLVNSKEFLLRR